MTSDDTTTDCPVCYGTGEGKHDGASCPNCAGRGVVIDPVEPDWELMLEDVQYGDQ